MQILSAGFSFISKRLESGQAMLWCDIQ